MELFGGFRLAGFLFTPLFFATTATAKASKALLLSLKWDRLYIDKVEMGYRNSMYIKKKITRAPCATILYRVFIFLKLLYYKFRYVLLSMRGRLLAHINHNLSRFLSRG